MHILAFFPTDMEVLYKTLIENGFAKPSGASQSPCRQWVLLPETTLVKGLHTYIHTHICTFSFFLQIWGCFTKPYRGVCKAPIQKGLCTHIHTHICTFWSVFLQIWGMLHKAPTEKGPCTHTCTFCSFSSRYRGASKSLYREGVWKAPSGFMKPL